MQLVALLQLREIAWLELHLLLEGSSLGVTVREVQLVVFGGYLQHPRFIVPKKHPLLYVTLEDDLLFYLLLLGEKLFEVYLVKVLEELELGGCWARAGVLCEASSD